MIERNRTILKPVVLMTLMAIVVFAVSVVVAQEEPTPVPEPPQEEPVATPEEPAPAEPQVEPQEAEPAPQAEAASPAAEPAPAPTEPEAAPEPTEASVPTVYRDKTLITVNGRAEMNGFIEFIVKPNDEKPTKVRANIIAKTKTKKITKELVGQLIFALGDRYKVKQTNDKTILVKTKNKKMPPVAITLMTQNLAGVSVMIGQG